MASTRSVVDINQELPNKNFDHLPPTGPLQQPNSQKGFYYRGNLFPSPINKISQLAKAQSTSMLAYPHSDADKNNFVRAKLNDEKCYATVNNPAKSPNALDDLLEKPTQFITRPRRIQSAKAVLVRHGDNTKACDKTGSFSVVNMNINSEIPTPPVVPKRIRPRSAVTFSGQKRHFTWEKSVSRPSSARKASAGAENQASDTDTKNSETDDNMVKPSVYGLRFKRQIYGSDPDIFNSSHKPLSNISPYVLSNMVTEEIGQGEDENKRSVPQTLEPLRPWLTTSIAQDLLCVDPISCLVFLPSLITEFEDLPVVPIPQDQDEELAQNGPSPPKPIVAKKYSHPFVPKTFEHVCNHSKTKNQICAPDGTVLHQRYQGVRTSKIIRKEILELENLMKGIGSHDSSCLMVRYQADITQLQQMVDDTLAKVPERLKHIPEPSDSFGIHMFCRDHDVIMTQIEEEHNACIKELALLEADVIMDEDLRHFCKREMHINMPFCM